MPWDKIIDRKVKSSDNVSIAPNYVKVKGGAVHKKTLFYPKILCSRI